MINTIYTFTVANMMTLAANVNIDGTIGEAEHFIHHLLGHINSGHYNYVHLLFNILFLSICFIMRYNSYFKIVNIDISTDDGKNLYKRYRSYVLNHIIISFIFANIVCYLLIQLVDSTNIIVIWNIIICPLIGYLASIWFDNKFLVEYETKYKMLRNPLNEKSSDSKGINTSKDSVDQHNEINININNGENTHGTDDKFVLEGDKELTDTEKIEATINRIIEVQKEQSDILERHTNELKDQNEMLKNMQSLMKNNIKFELEEMIYEVLDRGYVTPAEDKKIRVKYKDYRNNKGNGDLEELYESRYLELDVHEHR